MQYYTKSPTTYLVTSHTISKRKLVILTLDILMTAQQQQQRQRQRRRRRRRCRRVRFRLRSAAEALSHQRRGSGSKTISPKIAPRIFIPFLVFVKIQMINKVSTKFMKMAECGLAIARDLNPQLQNGRNRRFHWPLVACQI